MRRQRISQKQYLAATIIVLGLLLGTVGTVRAEFEFISQNIGYPVQEFKLVDIEKDGIWEVAVKVSNEPCLLGVYSPLLSQWIDGPHEIPVGCALWACGDFDCDSKIEYAHVQYKTVKVFYPSDGIDITSFTVDSDILGMIVWGNSSTGDPLVFLSTLTTHQDIDCWDDYISQICHESGVRYGRWNRYSLVTGEFLYHLYGWPLRQFIRFSGDQSPSAFLCFYNYSESFDMQSPHGWEYIWLNNDLTLIPGASSKSINLPLPNPQPDYISTWPPQWFGSWWPNMYHITIGQSRFDGLPDIFLIFGGSHLWYGEVEALIGGSVNPPRQGLDWFHIVEPEFAGMTYFDWDGDSTGELILPLETRNVWQIHDPQTGALIDSIPGLPPADVRTAPIMEADVLDLYYFLDSTLYILSRPGMPTDTTEEPDEPQEPPLPTSFALHQNYPNPFNTSTVIKFDLDQPASVKLDVYNILGQKVAALLDVSLPSGFHQVEWDGKNDNRRDVVSGIYFYRLRTGDLARTKKMVLLR